MSDESELTPAQEIERLRRRVGELERDNARLERDVREIEERYQAMLDWSDTGVWEWDIATREARMSPGWFKLIGREPEEVTDTAQTWHSMIHEEDKPKTAAAFIACMEGRTPDYEVFNRMIHRSGKTMWFRMRGKVYERDAEGRAVRMVGTVTDVTKQKETEDDLRRSQSLLQGLVEHAPAIINVRDLEWRYMLLNGRAEAAMKVDRAELIGKHDYELFPPEIIAEVRATDTIVLEKNEPIMTERTYPLKDGPRIFALTKFPIRDEHGKVIAIGGFNTDITERKRAEQEHLAMRERVIAAQRDALRELSTPLLPIGRGVVVMPLIGTIDSQRAQQLIEALLRGVVEHRAATVILDVTGVSVVDTHVAGALVQASKAVRLLGAASVLTGIRPEVAQTLVTMGAELGDIVIHGTLRGGIEYALSRDRAAVDRRR